MPTMKCNVPHTAKALSATLLASYPGKLLHDAKGMQNKMHQVGKCIEGKESPLKLYLPAGAGKGHPAFAWPAHSRRSSCRL